MQQMFTFHPSHNLIFNGRFPYCNSVIPGLSIFAPSIFTISLKSPLPPLHFDEWRERAKIKAYLYTHSYVWVYIVYTHINTYMCIYKHSLYYIVSKCKNHYYLCSVTIDIIVITILNVSESTIKTVYRILFESKLQLQSSVLLLLGGWFCLRKTKTKKRSLNSMKRTCYSRWDLGKYS